MVLLLDENKVEKIGRDSTLLYIHQITEYLQDHLGQKITAYVSGINDAKLVGKWISKKVDPHDLTKMRLRRTYHAARLIIEAYGSDTAKAWFFGTNTRLGDQSPAYLVRHAETLEDLPNIVPVAKAFAGTAVE